MRDQRVSCGPPMVCVVETIADLDQSRSGYQGRTRTMIDDFYCHARLKGRKTRAGASQLEDRSRGNPECFAILPGAADECQQCRVDCSYGAIRCQGCRFCK